MSTEELRELLDKYLAGSMTAGEIARFSRLLHASENDSCMEEHIERVLRIKSREHTAEVNVAALYHEFRKRAGLSDQNVAKRLAPVDRNHFRKGWRWAAAAAIFLLAGAGYFWFTGNSIQQQEARIAEQHLIDVPPGKDGAILTLADGSSVVLDSLGNGVVAVQGGAQVILNNGQLAYERAGEERTKEIEFNTIVTPKGRQFKLLLADGSRVWMNASSALRYPTAFSGSQRKVEISGEVYFEIASNKEMPFVVKINNETEVEVLGTRFNINSYMDESFIKATLLQGSVRVTFTPSGNHRALNAKERIPAAGSVLLKPGQQARIAAYTAADGYSADHFPAGRAIQIVDDADIDKVMAWKNELFDFEGSTLTDVMKQLKRWYDIEVIYPEGVPDIEFGGKIGRNLSLASLLKILDGAGVHFRLEEGRRLMILP